MLKFSVIIPVYNIQDYLIQCLESVVNQSYKNIEILIVNDGSTDGSPEICSIYEGKDNRVKVIHTSNSGLSAARNIGIRNSSGDYILFVDGDDFISTNTIYDISNIVLKSKNIDLVVGKMIKYYNESYQVVETFKYNSEKIDYRRGHEVLEYFFEDIPTIIWSACRTIYRRQFILENDFYFKEGITSEDLELIPRIYMRAIVIGCYDTPFYYYRQLRENSIINTVNSKRFLDLIEIIKAYIKMLEESHFRDEFKVSLRKQLADIYARYIVIIGQVIIDERKEVTKNMKELKFLLREVSSLRGRYVFISTNLFGFTVTYTVYKFLKQVKCNYNKYFRFC